MWLSNLDFWPLLPLCRQLKWTYVFSRIGCLRVLWMPPKHIVCFPRKTEFHYMYISDWPFFLTYSMVSCRGNRPKSPNLLRCLRISRPTSEISHPRRTLESFSSLPQKEREKMTNFCSTYSNKTLWWEANLIRGKETKTEFSNRMNKQ